MSVKFLFLVIHAPHAQSITVSIMGLQSYIEDEEIVKVLW